MTKELDSTQDAELEDQLIEELSMGMYRRPIEKLSGLESMKLLILAKKLLPRLVPFVKAQKIAHADMVIGKDETAYTEDRSRYFEHIFHQNNLRAEQRGRNEK